MKLDSVEVTTREISVHSPEYKQRRRQQMLRFFGATAFTLISARMAFRGVQTRKYLPNMFQLNHKPPPYSYQGEAISALAYGTSLATGGFAMLVLGTCWIADISSFPEFAITAKRLMGNTSESVTSIDDLKTDEDTRKVTEALEKLLRNEPGRK
ncbi:LAMI_0D12508g1_1 [Lachancea mirantina]|uniref:Altered inheritance of mitochondria protein 11 n=1 Tax=Lachancea mirantina TaxID=1230905 RepID=A0A1G4JGA9_9SACH|nr:LAMI_0D12508g1_1 [Lachancea mirantina]